MKDESELKSQKSLNTSMNSSALMRNKTDTNRLIDKSKDKDNKSRVLKRRYITRITWIVTLIVITLSFIFFAPFIALIISFSMGGLSALINVFILFVSPKKIDFSYDAYVTIVISYLIALIKFIIIPLDISTSLSVAIVMGDNNTNSTAITMKSTNATSNDTNDYINTSIHAGIDITWKVIYWTSIAINFLVMRFQIAYWSQGHPTVRQKVVNTFKLFLKQILIVGVIGTVALLFLIFKYSSLFKGIDFIKSIIQVINLVYCLTHILILLGYGMVELPFHFLSYTNSSVKLKISIRTLNVIRNEFEDAVNKLLKDNTKLLEICAKVIKNAELIPDERISTVEFASNIVQEIADYKFEINDLIKFKQVDGNIKEPKFGNFANEINDDILANMLITVKNDFYLCNKKEAALLRIYSKISQNCEIVNDFKRKSGLNLQSLPGASGIIVIDPRKKKRSLVLEASTTFNNNKKIAFLIPRSHPFIINLLTKMLSFFLISISLLFLVLQINLLFISYINFVYGISTVILNSNFYLNYFFIIFYFSYFVICCFYSLSQFKLFEIYILVPHHTNRFGMAFNASMFNTLILGVCYNLLYFYSAIYDKGSVNGVSVDATSASALNDFFNSMKKVEFIYGYYNYLFPIILIIIVMITLLRKFRLVCFKNQKFNNLEMEMDPLQDKVVDEIISEDTFKDIEGVAGKIKFEVLEKIQDIYYLNNEEETEKDAKESIEQV